MGKEEEKVTAHPRTEWKKGSDVTLLQNCGFDIPASTEDTAFAEALKQILSPYTCSEFHAPDTSSLAHSVFSTAHFIQSFCSFVNDMVHRSYDAIN